MKIRAVAFDMDDTLLRSDRTISEYTKAVLRKCKERGICVIPASGRAQQSLVDYVDQLGCVTCYIAYNGAQLYTPEHTPIFREELDAETVRELAAIAVETDTHCHVYDETHLLSARDDKWNDVYMKSTGLPYKVWGDLRNYQASSPKLLMMDEPEKVMQLIDLIRERMGDKVQVSCSKPTFLEVCPPLAAKGIALKRAGKLFGFTVEETVAFGDSLNDMNLLEAAGLSVAVGNGRPEVKKLVDRVCLSNDEDGVAHFVAELCGLEA